MRAYRAPGRVNLIGGQVDYHEGFVVSMAIDRDVQIIAAKRSDGRITARSGEYEGTVDVAADGSDDPSKIEPEWGRVIGGVAHVLADMGRAAVGVSLEIGSAVPIGAGLSSSAAFEVACALALCDVAHFHCEGHELAFAAQRAEHFATGVPCGVQDQLACVEGRAGHVLFIDCRTFDVEPLPLPEELAVVIVHSGVPRVLAQTPYAARRAETFAVAEQLGLRVLRDATLEQVRDIPRGRHAVTEMQRVREFAAALRRRDFHTLGSLMLASHASSRDDMQVSTSELDILVQCLCDAGAFGARLTGGGFGGCIVGLVPAPRAKEIARVASDRYHDTTGRDPKSWVVRPADGAGVLT